MERKKQYIANLLHNIQYLETKVKSVQNDDALSFSFFRDVFHNIQDMMKILHELEMHQIEDMKKQMEKLILFLSENETSKEQQEVSPPPVPVQNTESRSEADKPVHEIKEPDKEGVSSDKFFSEPTKERENIHARGVVLPTYINPRSGVEADESKKSVPKPEQATRQANDAVGEKNNLLSVNDVMQAPSSKIEVKRNLSLNDRFYYQRELFNNSREAMDAVMDKINSLNNITEIEDYLRKHTSWDFEDENVKGFLELLGKNRH